MKSGAAISGKFSLALFYKYLAILLVGWVIALPMAEPSYAGPAPNAKAAAEAKKEAKRLKRAKVLAQKAAQAIAASAAYDQAITYLEEATSLAPEWAEGWKFLAKVYLQLKNYANASRAYSHLVRLNPGNFELKREYAKCLVEDSKYDEAQKIWQEILDRNGNDAEAVYYMAVIAYNQEYYEDSLKLTKDACMLKPNFYKAMALQVKIYTKQHSYHDANRVLQALKKDLSPDNPALVEAESQEEAITKGINSQRWAIAICVGVVVGFIILALYAKRLTTKINIKAPPEEMDSMAEDSICDYVLAHMRSITQLPRGLCWCLSMDGRHIELMRSELIDDPSAFALRSFNRNSINDFVECFGKAPFLYKTVSKDALFKETFPGLAEELHGVEINVGVPIVWQSEFLGLILLGRSRNSDREEARRNFDRGMERMQEISEQGAAALDRLRQRKMKDTDTRTGLGNRDYFERKIIDISRGCFMVEQPLCAFMVTIDQASRILETRSEEFGVEFLYKIGALLQSALAKEPNVTLCHLDNCVFGVIAPERNADEGIRMATTLQTFMAQAELPDTNESATALVAWTLFPEDSNDPKMLRAVLSRAFRDARVSGGNKIVRAEKVTEATKAASAPVVEQAPEEKLIIRRNTPVGSAPAGAAAGTLPGITVPKITAASQQNAPSAAPSAPTIGVQQRRAGASAVSVNLAGASITAASRPMRTPTVAADGGKVERLSLPGHPARPNLASPSRLSIGRNTPQAEPFKLEIKLDEDGVDVDTQFCGEETFMSVLDDELHMADESGENCAVVYLRFANLSELRGKGKEAYLRIRKEIAALINAFLSDNDIPGLIGEDDLAVFMVGGSQTAAKNLADRVRLTASNIGAVKLAIGIVVRKANTSDGKGLIAAASRLAVGEGIHTN
ncbi:MAG: diguanylate cyclase domain-containing protein [Candidatus Bruticola sp.]